MKKIPIGVDDFKKLIENNALYIDKTKFITELLDDAAEVKLFIRPRRFGKTLNMSTLKYFFDIKNASENRKLFNGKLKCYYYQYFDNDLIKNEGSTVIQEMIRNS